MMNPPSRASVLATMLTGLYLIPPVHIQAQIVADVPSISSFTELQQVLDAAWVDRSTSALYPPGLTYTNSLPLIAIEAGFDPAFLSALQAGATPGGIALRKGIVREDLAGRLWFGSAATPVATTTFPVGYDPVQWVLDTFPPPPGTTGNDLDDYIADRRLTRQAMAFSLIATADVPAYEAELQARFAAAAAAAANLGEEDIGMIHVELTPPSGPMEILVRAPFWVDYLGVYETRDLMNPFPWTPLGTVPHTFDPMAWSYPLPGDLRYVILANHMVDSDGDGILDAIERLMIGTDPDKWDSDGDGIGDYAEVYIFESNPLLGGVGGVADQIILGLGIKTPDMTKVVSGPVELRHKTWRAERSKAGFKGLSTPNTFFARMTGRVKMAEAYDATMSGLYDIEKQDNRAQTSETDPLRHPSKNTIVVLPTALAGMKDDWGIGNGVGLWYPQPGDGVATTNNHVLITRPVTVSPPLMTYTAIDEVTLSEEYTDSMLRWKTLLDVLSIRMIGASLEWGGGRRLIRPMPWVTDSGTGQSSFDPNPQDVSAGSRAERHADTVGAPPVLTGLQLQQMAFQATSSDQTLPADHLLRTVLLEVHRSQPENPAEEGAVTKVVPKPVYLKHGTPIWESMVFEMPPPVENGTVEMVDGYADLVLSDTPEHMEFGNGNYRVVGQSVPFRVELLETEHLKARYRLEVKGPIGSQPQLKAQTSATWAGPILYLHEGIINGLPGEDFALMTDVPGRYTVLLKAQGTRRNTSGLLIEDGEEVSVDEIAITAVGLSFVPNHTRNFAPSDGETALIQIQVVPPPPPGGYPGLWFHLHVERVLADGTKQHIQWIDADETAEGVNLVAPLNFDSKTFVWNGKPLDSLDEPVAGGDGPRQFGGLSPTTPANEHLAPRLANQAVPPGIYHVVGSIGTIGSQGLTTLTSSSMAISVKQVVQILVHPTAAANLAHPRVNHEGVRIADAFSSAKIETLSQEIADYCSSVYGQNINLKFVTQASCLPYSTIGIVDSNGNMDDNGLANCDFLNKNPGGEGVVCVRVCRSSLATFYTWSLFPSSAPGSLPQNQWTSFMVPVTPNQQAEYIKQVAVHEVGHMLGLVANNSILGGSSGSHETPPYIRRKFMNPGGDSGVDTGDDFIGVNGVWSFTKENQDYLKFVLPVLPAN